MKLLLAIVLFCVPRNADGGEADAMLREAQWLSARVNAADSIRADKAVTLFLRHRARYESIEKMRANGVPAPVLFALHQRESGGDFTTHPHEGSPLTHRTRYVPKGRLPHPAPPYTFEQSAQDAYYVADRLDLKDWRHLGPALLAIESFNGMGYLKRGVPSPYLWAGTSIYTRGKYVADGRYSPVALDAQLGCAAILLRMRERGIVIPFAK